MHSLAAVEDNFRPLPDAKGISLRAQLAQRRASAAEALKPVETFQRVAWGVSALVLLFGLLANWTLLGASHCPVECWMGISRLPGWLGGPAFGRRYPDFGLGGRRFAF